MADAGKISTVAEDAPFSILCRVLDQVSKQTKPEKRREKLKKYIDVWRANHKKIHAGESGDGKQKDSFYPAMRLILPGYDKERGPYGFKEHMLAKKLIDILMMDKNGADAKRLLNYRAPQHYHGRETTDSTGDFAAVASDILRHRVSKSGEELKVDEVNRRLDAIAEANAAKDKARMDQELEMLCRKVDEVELKWLIRILLKQMKIGISENTVLNLFHKEANQLYDVTTSLQRVCEQLHDPEMRMDVIQIQLFTPFRPMLANRTAPERVEELMGHRKFYIEEKYDGERFQLHKLGDVYKYYSRNGNDFTSSYGPSSKEGSFTPYIHKAFKSSVKSCILDGEMVGWNPEAACVATKGEQFDVKTLKDGDDIYPCYVAFDCLMINDEVLTLKPLEERLKKLGECFVEMEGRIMFPKQEMKNTTQDVIEAMNWAIERREEGIVVKRPDSTYKLNVRSSEGGWLKIKPDYLDAINDDFDLLIIGGYYGEGSRKNLMSHFLLGLAIPSDKEGVHPTKFVSIAKVGTGYTMKELYDLNVELNRNPLRKGTASLTVPEWYSVGTEKPDVYVDPQYSKIVQVRAAEITVSKRFNVGYTLRFPRVQKIRFDKSWFQAMNVDEFHKLRVEMEGKIAQRLKAEADDQPSPTKKRRLAGAASHHAKAARPILGSQFRGANVKNVKLTSDIFHGKEFCIIGGKEEFSKQDLEKKVAEFGGKIVQHPGSKTFCVVADKKIVKVQNIIQSKSVNVVKASWLVECLRQHCNIPWKPIDMWYALPNVEKEFQRNFDEFGDSYTEPISLGDLRALLDRVKPTKLNNTDELDEFIVEYLPDYKYALFRRCRTYFDLYHTVGDTSTKILNSPLELSSAEYRLYGGKLVQSLENCTHMVLNSKDLIHLPQFVETNRALSRKFHVVTEKWVTDCIDAESLLSEINYQPLL